MNALPTVNLGDIAVFVRGINFKPEDVVPENSPGAVACMRTKNVQSELDRSDVWFVSKAFVKRDDQYLKQGDILVSSANSWNLVGKCCWIPELPWQSSFGGFVSVLRGNFEKVNHRYLFHWFNSGHIQSIVRSFGQKTTNISNLNIDRCLKLPIVLPSLSEQRRIADILDQADALRAKRRAAIAQLDELTESIFIDMFGDPVKNSKKWQYFCINSMGKVSTGSTPPSAKSGMFDGPIPFVTPGDLESNVPPKRSITENGAKESVIVKPGSTLVCCIGATIGKIGQATEITAFNQQINAIEWYDEINKDFGYMLMRFLKPVIISRGISTTLPILKKSAFEKIEIPVPPLNLQQKFAKIFLNIEKLKSSHRASLAELDALFASLQHRAFRGEL